MRRLTLPAILLVLVLAASSPAATGIVVGVPATVKGDLDQIGVKHRIEFAVDAPGLLTVRLKGKSGVTPDLVLLDPTDTPVDTSGFSTTTSTKDYVNDLPVTAEGTWAVLVSDAGAGTGSYKLKIRFERTEDFESDEAIATPGAVAEIVFRAEPGDVLKVKLKRRTGDLIPRIVEIERPDQRLENIASAKTSTSSKKMKLKKLTLTQSGDYTLRVTGEDATTGTTSVDVSLSFDTPGTTKVTYDGDDFGDLVSTTLMAHIDLRDRSDYRVVVYGAATGLRLDLPDPLLRLESDGSLVVRTSGGESLNAFLVSKDFTPPANSATVTLDGLDVFDGALSGDISGSAGLLRFAGSGATVDLDPVRGLFVSDSVHHSVPEIYELIRSCLELNAGTVFYPGSWPTQGHGTLPGRDGGNGAGSVSPHVDPAGALAVFASSLDAHGIDLVLVYDDPALLAVPSNAISRAGEIDDYNDSAGDSERVAGALVSFDVTPDASQGVALCDLLSNFASALSNAKTLAGTFPDHETLGLTWNGQRRPLVEQCLRAADGVVHHVRRTELNGPDSISTPLAPLTTLGDSLGLVGAVWAALDTTDRAASGGDASETFFGRPRPEFLEALVRTDVELGPIQSGAGPVILDRTGFQLLTD